MATTLGGAAYDVCNESLSSILGGMATHLQATKLAFRTRYVMINAEPDTSTIKVVRYINGDINQAVEIPQDEENGWTYAGAVSDVYTIDYPIAMNQASGYAIELHGTARLMGDDTADVTFNAAGSKDSISTR
jgi:glutamate 5-kinase